ncbi:MAG: TIGR00296 family protein, partial [Candidatus Methanoperedens sp.]|nr:TIGR00296 family protein [Candidatus Methanoperedens sp.]
KTEGETAVRLARTAIKECLENGQKIQTENLPDVFKQKRGVFVTLNKKKERKELRGCIGRPYPILPLGEAIILSAINAAQEDPRFYPVQPDEIGDLLIEVTILTVPERINAKPREIPEKIVIGRDGLIISTNRSSGLLLPQVAVEHGFESTEFLCQTSIKAGLMPDAWLEGAEVYSFEGQIFEEIEPGGKIKEKDIRGGED